jgi:hypothetical protein
MPILKSTYSLFGHATDRGRLADYLSASTSNAGKSHVLVFPTEMGQEKRDQFVASLSCVPDISEVEEGYVNVGIAHSDCALSRCSCGV